VTAESTSHSDTINFIERWASSGAAERANYQIFLAELCDVLEVLRPEPTKPDEDENAYVFEKTVTFHHGDGMSSTGRIDLYKRGCFVLEAKQGSEQQSTPTGTDHPKEEHAAEGDSGARHAGLERSDDGRARAGRAVCARIAGVGGASAVSRRR
jgi:hypothetical protein